MSLVGDYQGPGLALPNIPHLQKEINEAVEEEKQNNKTKNNKRSYKELGGGKYECIEEDWTDGYNRCYWEWWPKDMFDNLRSQWLIDNRHYDRMAMYTYLNANKEQPWRSINAYSGRRPPHPKREQGAETDFYYGDTVTRAAVIYQWMASGHLDQFGRDAQNQTRDMFSDSKADAVGFLINAENASQNVKDAAKKFIDGNIQGAKYIGDELGKGADDLYEKYGPSKTTTYLLYALLVMGLISVTAGGGAYLVHELKQ